MGKISRGSAVIAVPMVQHRNVVDRFLPAVVVRFMFLAAARCQRLLVSSGDRADWTEAAGQS